MSLIDLRISVDADEVTCGACHRRVAPTKAGGPSFCGVFGVGLTKLGDTHRRLTGCLAAESASRPWQRDEDDHDPVPHHLRGST